MFEGAGKLHGVSNKFDDAPDDIYHVTYDGSWQHGERHDD